MSSSKKLISTTLCASILALGLVSTANAALDSRLGGQAFYDTDLGISWLRDANLAASHTFGVTGIRTDGAMNWATARNWIEAINAVNYLGYSDWRLPVNAQPDASCSREVNGISFGFNCTGSEMGHLFYRELGGTAGSNLSTAHNGNYGLFDGIQSTGGSVYWTGTEYYAGVNAGYFQFTNGGQGDIGKSSISYVWPVRLGQVSAVPEPATLTLLAFGLIGLGFARRKTINKYGD